MSPLATAKQSNFPLPTSAGNTASAAAAAAAAAALYAGALNPLLADPSAMMAYNAAAAAATAALSTGLTGMSWPTSVNAPMGSLSNNDLGSCNNLQHHMQQQQQLFGFGSPAGLMPGGLESSTREAGGMVAEPATAATSAETMMTDTGGRRVRARTDGSEYPGGGITSPSALILQQQQQQQQQSAQMQLLQQQQQQQLLVSSSEVVSKGGTPASLISDQLSRQAQFMQAVWLHQAAISGASGGCWPPPGMGAGGLMGSHQAAAAAAALAAMGGGGAGGGAASLAELHMQQQHQQAALVAAAAQHTSLQLQAAHLQTLGHHNPYLFSAAAAAAAAAATWPYGLVGGHNLLSPSGAAMSQGSHHQVCST